LFAWYPDCGSIALSERWPVTALSNLVSCLARIEPEAVELLTQSLAAVARPQPVIVEKLRVTEIGLLAPSLLIIDVDGLDVDSLEMLRMLRFVLPACTIAVYTDVLEEEWARACHLAGANCLLSKVSDAAHVTEGLRHALHSGCFTDPTFRAA
jgi:DNA-binding NarL/FixJ family response regulator